MNSSRMKHNASAVNAYKNFFRSQIGLNTNLGRLSSSLDLSSTSGNSSDTIVVVEKEVQVAEMKQVNTNAQQANELIKTAENGLIIVEQILPFFQPEYTVTINMVPDLGIKRDVPIVLNSVDYQDSYDGNFTTRRAVIYTLNFTAKTYLFGPMTNQKVIKEVQDDLYTSIDNKVAGYSQFWIQEVLRKKLGFDGVIFSDDLNMAGAAAEGSYVDRVRFAIDAGCDCVLICNNREAVVEVLDSKFANVDWLSGNEKIERMRAQKPSLNRKYSVDDSVLASFADGKTSP